MSLDQIEMVNGPFRPSYQKSSPSPTQPIQNTRVHDASVLAAYLCELTRSVNPANSEFRRMLFKNKVYRDFRDGPHLSPDEIQAFLQATTSLENVPNYSPVIGSLATALIQKTHIQGIDHFSFNMNGIKPLNYFGDHLSTKDKRKLDLVVYGQLGTMAFFNSRCNVIVEATHRGFALNASGNCSVARDYNKTGLGEFHTIYMTNHSTGSRWFSQYGSSPSERFINYYDRGSVCYTPNPLLPTLFDNNGLSDIIIKVVSTDEFESMWKPAEGPFDKMRQLFGGRP